MKFEIDFNRDSEHNLLKILNKFDIKEEDIMPHPKYGSFSRTYINLKDFEELELLLHTVDYSTGGIYSAIISFDPATIFLTDNT